MDGKFIIENLLQQEESERLEFKGEATVSTLAKTVTAMLNGNGGDIVLGVNNKNRIVVGCSKDIKDLRRAIAERIRPAAPIDVHSVDYNGINVILISVWMGAQKPYHCDGTIYLKVGDEIIVANPENINNMLLDRKQSDFNWERMPVLGAEIEDLDLDEVRNTMKEYAKSCNENIQDEELFLMRSGLLKDGNLTNACIVLYAKNPSQFISQTRVKLSVFSSDSSSDLIEARLFEGNIFKNIDAIFQFIDMTYSKGVRIDGILREEQWNFPRVAVREGVMNAVVHRDYNSISGFMHILIYPNRLEIISYGVLPSMSSVIEKGGDGLSILRNPDIAHQCYYRKLIEMMGAGLPRMIHDSKEHGFDIPEFSIKDQIVKVTFPNIHYIRADDLRQDNSKNNMISHFEGVIEGLGLDLKLKMASILCVLNEQPGLRTIMIGNKTNIPAKSVERYIKRLKEAGLVKYIGSSKSGGYFLS